MGEVCWVERHKHELQHYFLHSQAVQSSNADGSHGLEEDAKLFA